MALNTNCVISNTHFWCLTSKQLVRTEFAKTIFTSGYHIIDGHRYAAGEAIDVVTRRYNALIEIHERIEAAIY